MQDGIILKGRVRTIECDAIKYPNYEDVDRAIANGEAEISEWKENLIPLVGRTAIARRLINAGINTNEAIITYGAVGTDNTAPDAGNTTLGTEIFRKLIAYAVYADNVVTIRTYLTTLEGNGALKEFGLFGEEATGVADTGTMFEHIAMDKTKTTGKTLTIESEITIS